ncbi:MAG: glycosyltransferase family 9 protein [Candidatus Adiutrix sp.]|jgi:heptosyltransferase-1|nr:glycosyltransferase family 9 protein [Candidatus Adiutrix sp.]
MAEPGKILIVKMSALGDVVMSLPALQALSLRYPAAAIDWLAEPPVYGLLEKHPRLGRVLVWPRRKLGPLARARRFVKTAGLARAFLRELRAVEYDVVLDLQGLLKSAAMVFISKGRRKVGFAGSREKTAWALSELMPAYDPERHAVRRYLDAAVYLGAVYPDPEPLRYYDPPPEAARRADECLQGDHPFIVLNPGARWATKQWPLAHWETLARELGRQGGLRVVITGGPEDRPWGAAIKKAALGAPLDLCGLTPLPVLAAVMEKAAFVVTADTGPMHLAAAVGARGLALFGPTRPARTGPFGGHFKILTPPRDCLGCLKRVCPTGGCLAEIAPQRVLAEIQGEAPG